MKIQYLGTGAAEGIPALFCNCDFCNKMRMQGIYHTRSQVVIDDELSIDFPPDAYMHSLQSNFNLGKIKYVLATHSHLDHFYAQDFVLRGYKYATKQEHKLEIYGNSECRKVFDEATKREIRQDVLDNIEFCEIEEYQILNIGEYRVITLPANHSKMEQALLLYVEKNNKGYLHFYDTGLIDSGVIKFLSKHNAKADLVSFDCTLVNDEAVFSSRHLGLKNDINLRDELRSYGVINEFSKCVVTHFSHNGMPTPEQLQIIEKNYGFITAYDGMVVEI